MKRQAIEMTIVVSDAPEPKMAFEVFNGVQEHLEERYGNPKVKIGKYRIYGMGAERTPKK